MPSPSPISVRRVLQGGLAFVAFGALGVAAAAPAYAENGEVGYAHAEIAGDAAVTVFYPREADFHGTNRYLTAYDDEVFALSNTFVLTDIDTDELLSRVTFEELRVELTEADLEAMREAAENGVSQPGLENPEGGSDEPVLHASFTGVEIKVAQNWAGDREFTHDQGTESIEVNELGAEISFVAETEPWHETLRNESLRWQNIDVEQELWGGRQTLEMVVTFPDEGFSVSYGIGETIVASDTDPAGAGEEDPEEEPGDGGGDDEAGSGDEDDDATGGDGQDEGRDEEGGSDDGDPAEEDGRDPSEEEAKDESGGPLAKTGGPVAALIAAGAAVTAGGGAAVYLVRRKKAGATDVEQSDEG